MKILCCGYLLSHVWLFVTPMDPTRPSVHGDSPGKNTGVGCHALHQGIFPTQGSNLGLPELQADSLLSEPPRKPSENSKCVQIGLKIASYCFNLWCLIVGQMGLFSQVNKLFEFFPVPVWSLSIFFFVFILRCWYVWSLYTLSEFILFHLSFNFAYNIFPGYKV